MKERTPKTRLKTCFIKSKKRILLKGCSIESKKVILSKISRIKNVEMSRDSFPLKSYGMIYCQDYLSY